MEYVNGFAREEFLQYMFNEFPSVFNNTFSRTMLENIVDSGINFHSTSKNSLYYYLKDMVPEVEPNDLIPYFDKKILTDEVLCFVEEPDIRFTAGYYEWNVWRGDDNVYTFGDVPGDEEINDVETLETVVDDCIDSMQFELREDEKNILSEKEVAVLKERMIEVWKNHLCLEDKTESINDTLADATARSEKTNTDAELNVSKDELEI